MKSASAGLLLGPSPLPSGVFPGASPPPAGRPVPASPGVRPALGPRSPGRPRGDLVLEHHPAPLRRTAARGPLWKEQDRRAGRVIDDPDRFFRKQKLTGGGLGWGFEVHGFVSLQLNPSFDQTVLGSFYPPPPLLWVSLHPISISETLPAWICIISNNIARSGLKFPTEIQRTRGNILSRSPDFLEYLFYV